MPKRKDDVRMGWTDKQWRMLLEVVLRLLYRLYPKITMDV